LPKLIITTLAGPILCVGLVIAIAMAGYAVYTANTAGTLSTAASWVGSFISSGSIGGGARLFCSSIPPGASANLDAFSTLPVPSLIGWIVGSRLAVTVRGYVPSDLGDIVLVSRNETEDAARRYVNVPIEQRLETAARVVQLQSNKVPTVAASESTLFLVLYRAGVTAYDSNIGVLLQCRVSV
jgi:hypothetical protein